MQRAVPDRRPGRALARARARRSARPGTSSGSTRPSIRSRSTFGLGDIRLTSRYAENDLISLFTAMHECGSRPLRVGREPDARAHAALRGRLGDAARVAEPALGERRRPLAAVLALVLPARAGDVPGSAGQRPARELPPGRQPRRAARSSASTPTRRATACTSSSASSSSRSSSRAASPSHDLPDAWNARFEELMGIAVPERLRSASCRTRTGREAASATSRRTSSAPCSPSRSGRRRARRSRTSTSRSSAASSASCTRGCARTSTRSVAS